MERITEDDATTGNDDVKLNTEDGNITNENIVNVVKGMKNEKFPGGWYNLKSTKRGINMIPMLHDIHDMTKDTGNIPKA